MIISMKNKLWFLILLKSLFERLQMKDTLLNLCIQSGHRLKALNAVMDAREELLVKYLGNCYLRLDQEEESLKRKCSKVYFYYTSNYLFLALEFKNFFGNYMKLIILIILLVVSVCCCLCGHRFNSHFVILSLTAN